MLNPGLVLGMTLTLARQTYLMNAFFLFKAIPLCLLNNSIDEELFVLEMFPPISTSFPGLNENIFIDRDYLQLCI